MKEEFYFGLEVTLQKKVSQVKPELFNSFSSILPLFSVSESCKQRLINLKYSSKNSTGINPYDLIQFDSIQLN